MRTIESVIGRELRWVQPSIFRRNYELRAGDIIVARLEWLKLFGTEARGESGDGCWLFSEKGLWRPTVEVRVCEQETPLVAFREEPWKRKQPVALSNGRTVVMNSNFWRTLFTLETKTGEPLAVLRQRGFFGGTFDVEFRRRGASLPEFPWLVQLQSYLVMNSRRRSRAHAAGG